MRGGQRGEVLAGFQFASRFASLNISFSGEAVRVVPQGLAAPCAKPILLPARTEFPTCIPQYNGDDDDKIFNNDLYPNQLESNLQHHGFNSNLSKHSRTQNQHGHWPTVGGSGSRVAMQTAGKSPPKPPLLILDRWTSDRSRQMQGFLSDCVHNIFESTVSRSCEAFLPHTSSSLVERQLPVPEIDIPEVLHVRSMVWCITCQARNIGSKKVLINLLNFVLFYEKSP